jgi:hypothetical protein
MRSRTIVWIGGLAFLLTFSFAVLVQGQGQGNIDHTGKIPSLTPPAGWKRCPRCQNSTDRAEANKQYKVEGHPFDAHDLSGVWGFHGNVLTFAKTPPPLTPLGREQHEATLGGKNANGEPLYSKDTSGGGSGSQINCDPLGWPRLYTYNYGFEFIMLPDRVLQFFELSHTWRTIWTDGRKLPQDPPEPHWMGWNVGHWEGDTFVVESNGFDDRSWLSHHLDNDSGGGWPHSDEMRIVERWRRVNYATLEAEMTVTDPKTYTAPWVTTKATMILVPGAELWENFCVPSDYNEFNNRVFVPTSGGAFKK